MITRFAFSRFLVPSRQRNHRKSFYCHGKYFAKENFRAPAWTSAKCYCGNKTGNPERAVSLHLARSGSQSQRGIWFILPARGACHICGEGGLVVCYSVSLMGWQSNDCNNYNGITFFERVTTAWLNFFRTSLERRCQGGIFSGKKRG